jgi:WD40 repeat protein
LSLQQTKSSPGSTAQQPVYQEILWDAITWQRRQVWDIADWGPYWFHPDESKLLSYSRTDAAPYPGVAWSPSGQRLAVGGGYWDMWDTPEERYARVLDREGRLLARLEDRMGEVVADLEFLSETEVLVATDGALRWWNTESNEVRLLREGYSRIALSEGFFIAEHAKEVWRYDRATLTGRRLMEADRSGTFVTALAIAPDASCVAVGYADGSMRVQRFDEEQSHYLPGTGAAIWSLRMGPKAYWLAALSSNGHLRYWPIPRGRPLEARPLDEFLDILRAQTNLRVVTDLEAPEGYQEVTHDFPGWDTAPAWQEWYSEAYMEDPPWKPMLDPATIPPANH